MIVFGISTSYSTLYDIIRFQRYWSDYILEFISCFFVVFIVLKILLPAKVPKIIIDYVGVIAHTLYRGIVFIFFSSFFLGDKHTFHKMCSILLFIVGLILILLGYISPETSEQLNSNIREVNVNNTSKETDDKNNDSMPEPEILDKTPTDN